jgi:hypothetical protein
MEASSHISKEGLQGYSMGERVKKESPLASFERVMH